MADTPPPEPDKGLEPLASSGVGKIGLIAGNGLFPICFARAARGRGIQVVAVAIKGEASPELKDSVDEIHWTGIGRLGKWIDIFHRAGVARAVMCGGVTKTKMFDRLVQLALSSDLRSKKLWFQRLKSRQDHTVLEAVADELEREGIKLESSVLYCPELLTERGCLTRRRPTEKQWEDIRFAWPIAKQIAALQVGQTVVVKDGAVIAVEGIDGTDATLRRGGDLGRGDVVAVKVAKEGHDERFDVPCVGPETVGVLKEAGVAVLAIQAGSTIVLERDQVKTDADKARLCIIAAGEEDI